MTTPDKERLRLRNDQYDEARSLAAERRAEEDREIEGLEAADIAEDKYLDSLDTLGGASPNDRDDRSIERDQY